MEGAYKIGIKDLLVVSTRKATPMRSEAGRNSLFVADSCARQLYVGRTSDLESVPDLRDGYVVKTGAEAYCFLLRVMCGLDSEKKGEPHVAGQVRDRWVKFSGQNGKTAKESGAPRLQRARELTTIMDSLFEDEKKIRRSILQGVKPVDKALAARDLLGIKGGEEILVIAGYPHITGNVIRALGRDGSRTVKGIDVVNIGGSDFSDLSRQLENAARVKKVVCPFRFLDRAEEGRDYSHAFVTLPMGERDQEIFDLWLRIQGSGKALVFMSGIKGQWSESNSFWREKAENDGKMILPEAVYKHKGDMEERNAELFRRAEMAAENCALSRVAGKTPRQDFLHLPQEEYAREVGLQTPGSAGATVSVGGVRDCRFQARP